MQPLKAKVHNGRLLLDEPIEVVKEGRVYVLRSEIRKLNDDFVGVHAEVMRPNDRRHRDPRPFDHGLARHEWPDRVRCTDN